ncbi:MAG: YceD family protein [candidate division SR1 bacterium]|nr:YceD family protein [candidate division SR1 bacterium]
MKDKTIKAKKIKDVTPEKKEKKKAAKKDVATGSDKPFFADKSGKIKDKIFKIKIADLLNETGKQDEIVFEHKFSDQLPNLDDEGIAANFTVQSLDNTSLLGTLTDVTARFHETCDSCGASFMRSVDVPSYTARFVFEDEITKKKESVETEEVVLYIDPKAETINIEDMVVQAILLNDPFVKRCDTCTKRLESVDDEDDFDEFQSKGNIIFS